MPQAVESLGPHELDAAVDLSKMAGKMLQDESVYPSNKFEVRLVQGRIGLVTDEVGDPIILIFENDENAMSEMMDPMFGLEQSDEATMQTESNESVFKALVGEEAMYDVALILERESGKCLAYRRGSLFEQTRAKAKVTIAVVGSVNGELSEDGTIVNGSGSYSWFVLSDEDRKDGVHFDVFRTEQKAALAGANRTNVAVYLAELELPAETVYSEGAVEELIEDKYQGDFESDNSEFINGYVRSIDY